MSQDIWRMSAEDIVRNIRERTISSREAVDAHLARIGAVNGALNAVTQVLTETARAAADAADAALASGDAAGALHGLPVTVKENIDVAGSPTTQGVVGLKDWTPKRDAPVIRHLKSAGAIVIGRTNMPDYGLRWHTDNELHGPTANPWDAKRTPGGSSGGEAAALATGMSPLGIGNDMGGSTRQPAVACGVAGLRPSTGRVSRTSSALFEGPPMFYGRVACVNGPMARRVGDLRLALAAMSAPDPADPVWTPAAPPPAPGRLRVGLIRDPSGDGVDAPVAHALDTAAGMLRDAGYHVDEIEPPMLKEADETIRSLAETEFADGDGELPPSGADARAVFESVMDGQEPQAMAYHEAIAQQYRIAQAWSRLFETYPLVVGPVSSMETFEVGYDLGGRAAMRRLIRSFRLTELVNLTGLPSVAVPVGIVGGLPQGVQIIGRRFDEDRCFDAAEAIERVAGVTTPIDPC